MKKYLFLFALLTAALSVGLIVGCQDKNPSSIPPNTGGGIASIEIRLTHEIVRGFINEQRTETVTAIARDATGGAVPGKEIQFSISPPAGQSLQVWMGTIAPAGTDTATNIDGQFFGTYSVQLQRSTKINIVASSGNVVSSRPITLTVVDNELGGVSIESPEVLRVAPNEAKQVTVSAFVYDRNNVGITGVQVKFRTANADPDVSLALGTVDSDTGTTNFDGRVYKTFSTIVGRYGICRLQAQVGDTIATKDIQILPVSEPAKIFIHTDTPSITVAENQNSQIFLSAWVTDVNRNGVPDATVEFRVEPYQGGTTFGAIAVSDTIDRTNQDGIINATFTTLAGTGKVFIVASVLPSGGASSQGEAIENEVSITVTRWLTGISELTISAIPSSLQLSPDENGQSLVKARVLDTYRRAIPNLEVKFSVDKGSLANPTLTDSTGTAQVEFFILPATDLMPDTRDTVVTVSSEIVGTGFQADARISIRKSSSEIGSLTIYSQKTEIYADGNVTLDTIRAILKDADNQVMSDKEIIFTCANPGSVVSPIQTDSAGVATTIFNDIGLPSLDDNGQPVALTITAKYSPMGLEASTQVTILKRDPVKQINLIVGANQLIAGRGDSTSVQATCVQQNGERAVDGTQVTFRCQGIPGRFTRDQAYIQGGNGQVESFFITPSRSGTALLSAFVVNEEGDSAISNIVPITVLPGPPSRVIVSAIPNTLITNDPNAFSTITVTVTDTFGNPVTAGTQVWFRTNLGIITGSSITDTVGRATARLTPAVRAGIAEITALVRVGADSIFGVATVTFVAGGASRISLAIDTTKIQVRGTGGLESAQMFAWVYDALGNLISAPVPVIFQLILPPEETNINNHGITDSTFTSGGLAVVTLNSGIQSGIVLVRAITWVDPDTRQRPISVAMSICQIVAGPPDLLDIDVNDDGKDAGGGAWSVEVSARIFDIYKNPVADGIPVTFTVDPEIATIDPSQTGIPGLSGTALPGLAYSQMKYNSYNTFDTLNITATVLTLDGEVTGQKRDKALPMQQGTLQLNVSPINWMFDRNTPLDKCLIRIWAVLQDGHQIKINNGPVLFTTARGKISWADFRGVYHEYEPPEPAIKYTGWRPPDHPTFYEEDGIATVFLIGIMADFFLDAFSLETTVQLDAGIVGYDDVTADPGFVFMTRH